MNGICFWTEVVTMSEENVLWSGTVEEYCLMAWGPRETWGKQPEVPAEPLPGVRAIEVVDMARRMGIAKKKLIHALGYPRGEVVRKAKGGAYLNAKQSELFHGLKRMIRVVHRYYPDKPYDATFNPERWMGRFLLRRHYRLGGSYGADYMNTIERQEHVENAIVAPIFGVCV